MRSPARPCAVTFGVRVLKARGNNGLGRALPAPVVTAQSDAVAGPFTLLARAAHYGNADDKVGVTAIV